MFERGNFGNGILLADNGYALTKYCITPILTVQTPAENLFNESQIRTRNPIERTFGVWKRRFPILAVCIRLQVWKTQALIVATAILHKIAVIEKDIVLLNLSADLEAAVNYVNNVADDGVVNRPQNNNIRNPYIQYFQNLI
ncbi:unnamed protein product [Macrosiphum euphorbiae]|uniref:DDE Tnp4 domain-containing protein n=1 Tax=Macrosiphum euphorbiae TaxID=13131 RepID=A0AAV0WEG0_9HEMI|nr:unnamed protein product [Macrosiphum euphorbiae]